MKNKKLLPIPKFKNEDAERDFWDKTDTSLYFDWSKARHVKFPNLKFSTEQKLSLKNGQKKTETLSLLKTRSNYR